jgi:hypothetical protein
MKSGVTSVACLAVACQEVVPIQTTDGWIVIER